MKWTYNARKLMVDIKTWYPERDGMKVSSLHPRSGLSRVKRGKDIRNRGNGGRSESRRFFQCRCDVCYKSPTNGRHLFSLEHPYHQGCISSALWATFRRKVRPGYSVDIIARDASFSKGCQEFKNPLADFSVSDNIPGILLIFKNCYVLCSQTPRFARHANWLSLTSCENSDKFCKIVLIFFVVYCDEIVVILSFTPFGTIFPQYVINTKS